jgi:hypothetical protein
MNTFEMLLLLAGTLVGIAGISVLSHAVLLWRKVVRSFGR